MWGSQENSNVFGLISYTGVKIVCGNEQQLVHHAQNIRQARSACYQGLGTKPHTVHYIGHNNNTIHLVSKEVMTKATGQHQNCLLFS